MSDCCETDTCAVPPAPAPRAPWWTRSSTHVVLAGVLIGVGVVASSIGGSGAESLARTAYLMAMAWSLPGPVRGAWRAISRRVLDINVLMVIAVVGALVLGEWLEAASVVWLFGVAEWLEARTVASATRAIRDMIVAAPERAIVRRSGIDADVPVADVAVGDSVIVRPGARVPVDGSVLLGESTIDEAPVTGESVPVEKVPGDVVYAGTINGAGALEVRCTAVVGDSTLARVVRLVEQSQRERAPIETWVSRFARRYTPAVVVAAALVALVPPLLGGLGTETSTWVYRSLALLVVACPCAFVISTPVSIAAALTTALRHGVLVKGGAHLERLGSVTCMAFDKTGTLTSGKVTVADVRALGATSTRGVVSVAAALEAWSDHPIGKAIVDHARLEGIAAAPSEGCRALPGLGAEGAVDERDAVVGSHRLFEERRLCTPALHAEALAVEASGRTPVLVGHDGAALGVVEVSDTVRPNGSAVVAALRRAGVTHVVLLTGDHDATARQVQTALGLDAAHAGLLPADKVDHVHRLRREQGVVAMVGDGINDAPALAAADVGIAMGRGGAAVAVETADVALLGDDLDRLPFALNLGRRTLSIIRTNVAIALGVKLVFVVLAASGMATLWMAVLADSGASVVVTANALRLLRTGPAPSGVVPA